MEFNIVLAASFWLGMKWRRANRAGAWSSMVITLIFFGIIPLVLPAIPGVRYDTKLLKTVDSIEMSRIYVAREIDAEKRQAEIESWEQLPELQQQEVARRNL